MFARFLYLDNEAGRAVLHASLSGKCRPDWSGQSLGGLGQVWAALARLDGRDVTNLIVAERPPGPGSDSPFSGKAMSIGGGANDEYICEAFVDDEEPDPPMRLINPSVPRTREMVYVNRGQLGEWPRFLVVGRALVKKALETFVRTGDLNKELSWFGPNEKLW